MKHWPWGKILASFACLLIVIGIVPPAALFFGGSHNFFPLEMPLPLKSGEYTSQLFTTDWGDTYEIYIIPADYRAKKVQLNLDWKIVDENGNVIQQGRYSERTETNWVTIGEYQPKIGQRQKIIIKVNQNIEGNSTAQPRLIIGLPQRNSDYFDVRDIFNAWAVITAGPGTLLLFFLLFRRLRRPKIHNI